MKKVLNLSVILAVLMAAFSFSSCGKDDENAAKISIEIETTTTNAIVVISSPDEKLSTIELWENGSKLKNIDIPAEVNGIYTVTITQLTDGEYTLKATSNSGAAEKKFTIGEGPVTPDTFEAILGGSGATDAGSFLSIEDEKVYFSNATDAQLANVEIVFDGTTFKSATESANSKVKANGNSATITKVDNDNYSYATSTGYQGTIKINSRAGSGDATKVTVTVVKM
ncbi:MAG: hypothetical protein LBR52_00730 [Prevotellaceae bacterium]|nr:hypothetical protein [Prevotellaceae bacterium]